MKVAIMQPYFLPYIGYFQLIDSSDVFVVYDDVNFIKKGWINRNNILVNSNQHLFSIALKNASQNKRINEIEIENSEWKSDLLKTITLAYKKAPFFSNVFPMLEAIIENPESNLSKYIINSMRKICIYLDIQTQIVVSSEIEKDNGLKAQDKIIEVCKKTNAAVYINAIGGMDLYDKAAFANENITLRFLKTGTISYPQFKSEFIPWLSIIDVLMFNSEADAKNLLNQKEFLS